MARERAIILDDDEPPAPKRPAEARETPRFGFEWGLASTIMGAIFVVSGPLFLIVLMSLSRPYYDDSYSVRSSVSKYEVVAYGGILAAIALCIAGLLFGIRGLGRARLYRTPAALPITGMLLCFAAICFWVVVMIVVAERNAHY